MTFAEAVTVLAENSGWKRSDVVADPDSALWAASGRLVEARDVIRKAKTEASR